jgi:Type II CAAX prenyl endopeptidase Rce1-like
MKYFRIKESVMWVLLSISAVAGVAVIGWQVHDEWNILPEAEQQPVLSVPAVTEVTGNFLTEHFTVDATAYESAAVLTTAFLPDTFLSKSYLSETEQSAYRDRYLSAPTIYSVRYFKPEQIEEYRIDLDAYRGDVVSFAQTLPEDAVIPEVAEDVALEAARLYVASILGVEAESLTVHTKEEKKLPGGTVRNITLAWQGSEVDSEFGKGFTIFEVIVRGDKVVSFAANFEYPEAYERELMKSSTIGGLVGFGSLVAWVVMIIASLVATIRFFSTKNALYKTALAVTIVLAVLGVIDAGNTYTEIMYAYSTIDSMTTHLILTLFVLVLLLLIPGLMFVMPAIAGITLAVTTDRDRIEPLTALPNTAERRSSYRQSLVRGYLLGVAFLGFTLGLYWVGETYLGVWYPVGDMLATLGLNSFVPAFSLMVILGIGAAITEEVTFRLFGILWLRRLTKSTFVAVCVATAIWAFAHTDGSVLPAWFRGAEVFVGGLLFAYFFIRYNILTTITAHYVHNILIACMILYFTFGMSQVVPMLLILMMPVIVYLLTEFFTKKIS